MTNRTKLSLCHRALAALDAAGMDWCALNGYHDLLDRVESDVDVVVSPRNFGRACRTVRGMDGARIVQEKRYAWRGRVLTLSADPVSGPSGRFALDIFAAG